MLEVRPPFPYSRAQVTPSASTLNPCAVYCPKPSSAALQFCLGRTINATAYHQAQSCRRKILRLARGQNQIILSNQNPHSPRKHRIASHTSRDNSPNIVRKKNSRDKTDKTTMLRSQNFEHSNEPLSRHQRQIYGRHFPCCPLILSPTMPQLTNNHLTTNPHSPLTSHHSLCPWPSRPKTRSVPPATKIIPSGISRSCAPPTWPKSRPSAAAWSSSPGATPSGRTSRERSTGCSKTPGIRTPTFRSSSRSAIWRKKPPTSKASPRNAPSSRIIGSKSAPKAA